MNAPLVLGNDPRNMNADEKKLLLNKEIIAINQDKSGQGTLVIKQPGYQVWKKKMSDGSTALLLLNLETKNKNTIIANFTELGLKNKLRARDVIMQKDIGIVKRRLIKELAPHASSLIMLK
jgi:alpha-galactosidase